MENQEKETNPTVTFTAQEKALLWGIPGSIIGTGMIIGAIEWRHNVLLQGVPEDILEIKGVTFFLWLIGMIIAVGSIVMNGSSKGDETPDEKRIVEIKTSEYLPGLISMMCGIVVIAGGAWFWHQVYQLQAPIQQQALTNYCITICLIGLFQLLVGYGSFPRIAKKGYYELGDDRYIVEMQFSTIVAWTLISLLATLTAGYFWHRQYNITLHAEPGTNIDGSLAFLLVIPFAVAFSSIIFSIFFIALAKNGTSAGDYPPLTSVFTHHHRPVNTKHNITLPTISNKLPKESSNDIVSNLLFYSTFVILFGYLGYTSIDDITSLIMLLPASIVFIFGKQYYFSLKKDINLAYKCKVVLDRHPLLPGQTIKVNTIIPLSPTYQSYCLKMALRLWKPDHKAEPKEWNDNNKEYDKWLFKQTSDPIRGKQYPHKEWLLEEVTRDSSNRQATGEEQITLSGEFTIPETTDTCEYAIPVYGVLLVFKGKSTSLITKQPHKEIFYPFQVIPELDERQKDHHSK